MTLAAESQKIRVPAQDAGRGGETVTKKRSRPTGKRNAGRLGLVLLGCVVALLATGSPLIAAQPVTAKPKLLLLPIVVHSSEDPEYVRAGLSDMLAARFSRIGALQLIRESGLADGTTDLAAARVAGKKAGADFVLFGSFTRFGQGASLDVQCAPVVEGKGTEPLREIFVHSGSIGEIIPDLDDLAGKVSRFARGEIVGSPAATAAAPGAAVAPEPDRDLEDLILRIEALEESVTQILESEEANEDTGKLR